MHRAGRAILSIIRVIAELIAAALVLAVARVFLKMGDGSQWND